MLKPLLVLKETPNRTDKGRAFKILKHNNLLWQGNMEHITSKNNNTWQPQIVHKKFQNQKKVNIFEESITP